MTNFDPTALFWLPDPPADWRRALAEAIGEDPRGQRLRGFCSNRLNISQLRSVAARIADAQRAGVPFSSLREVRIGLVGSGTLEFLADAVPGTAPRFGMTVSVAPVAYNSLANAASGRLVLEGPLDCAVVMPDLGNFVLPARLLDEVVHREAVNQAEATLKRMVATVRQSCTGTIILATIPPHPDLAIGSSDRAMWGTHRRFIADLNSAITDLARQQGHALWDLEAIAAETGARQWRDPVSFFVAKSPFSISLAPYIADRLCAMIAGIMGKSRRALVLDLDNTLWGGVIGDDGLDGIIVGQGDAVGEAHASLQAYALALHRRGVVLCVCSKNEEDVAREPFRSHPDMLLREDCIGVFQANWNDKATNLQAIAEQLSLGTDALVFVDDNPAERARVRQMLPEVAVPELPEDPAFYTTCLAAGGYFENAELTSDDLTRAASYQDNAKRAEIRQTLGDYDAYLDSLRMQLDVRPFDGVGRARIAQLINKSNQFNLTTRRRSETEVAAIEADDAWLGLQFRLSDSFGDNGMISVVILHFADETAIVDTWLMSCRVLERKVEQAVLNLIVAEAAGRNIGSVLGEFVPSARNQMVSDHYAKLGFELLDQPGGGGASQWQLSVTDYKPFTVPLAITIQLD